MSKKEYPSDFKRKKGFVAWKRNKFVTSGFVVIYDAEKRGFEPLEKYAIACEEHGQYEQAEELETAKYYMKNPQEFCWSCKRLYSNTSQSSKQRSRRLYPSDFKRRKGFVDCAKHPPIINGYIVIYNSVEAGYEDVGDYAILCESHRQYDQVMKLEEARELMNNPKEFCLQCKSIDELDNIVKSYDVEDGEILIEHNERGTRARYIKFGDEIVLEHYFYNSWSFTERYKGEDVCKLNSKINIALGSKK